MEQSHIEVAMRNFIVEASLDVFIDSSSTPSRPGSRKTARSGASRQSNRAALSSRGSNAVSSRGKQQRAEVVQCARLEQFADAEAWLRQGLYLAQHGQYAVAKVCEQVVALTCAKEDKNIASLRPALWLNVITAVAFPVTFLNAWSFQSKPRLAYEKKIVSSQCPTTMQTWAILLLSLCTTGYVHAYM